ncbi:MAG: serine/threonine protein kinase, partial [Phycisphaerae bacterium]
ARSKIFLAKDLRTGKPAAVKVVVRESAEDDRFIEQVETEHEICSAIDHKYLRKTYEIHRVRKLLTTREVMLVMEYFEGLTLEEARPNRLNTFLTVIERVAKGLQALHAAGYVHSDLKPSNILLGEKGAMKIIDFGQSCPIGHKKDRIQGTPDFIAPEQVRRLRLDERTDVYNLGATMYWLLTSENYPTVLHGTGPDAGNRLTVTDTPLAPIELNDKIPVSLSTLVMECCNETPSERPADMAALLARLAVVKTLWQKHLQSLRDQQAKPEGELEEGE